MTGEQSHEAPENDGSGSANLMFFMIICLPIGLGMLGGPDFFTLFLGMIHEMGHFVVMIITGPFLPGNNLLLVLLAGGGTETLVPLVSCVLFLRDRRFFVAGCVFLAATGAALQDNGRYMLTAQNPSGYSFISNQPMTTENNDWSRIFWMTGLTAQGGDIASLFYNFGLFLKYLGFFSAPLGLFFYDKGTHYEKIFLYGSSASLVYTLVFPQYHLTVAYLLAGIVFWGLLYLKE